MQLGSGISATVRKSDGREFLPEENAAISIIDKEIYEPAYKKDAVNILLNEYKAKYPDLIHIEEPDIDEDDIFDTTDDMNNIPIDYSNPGSKVKITIPSTGISLNKTAFSLERGTCETLIATIVPQKTTDTVTWKSSDETVATVDNNGLVTAKNVGTVTITAYAADMNAAIVKKMMPYAK